MNQLLKYKTDTLSQLSVLCGSTIRSTKAERSKSILKSLNFYLSLPPSFNLVSVDIGIKNFSYCKLNSFNINNFDINKQKCFSVSFESWKTLNLADKYPIDDKFLQFNIHGSFEDNDLLLRKYYLSYMNHRVYEDLVKDSKELNIMLIETQRTKSNNNKVTLPNILDNYHFENLFYSRNLSNRLTGVTKTSDLMVPMNSNRMTSFLINRFLIKDNINSKSSKKLRLKLLAHLITTKKIELTLPGSDGDIEPKKLLKLYNELEPFKITKLDDLFDSFLYNLSFLLYYYNGLWIHHYLRNDMDLVQLVDMLNLSQLKVLTDLFDQEGYTLNDTFKDVKSVSLPGPIRKPKKFVWGIEE